MNLWTFRNPIFVTLWDKACILMAFIDRKVAAKKFPTPISGLINTLIYDKFRTPKWCLKTKSLGQLCVFPALRARNTGQKPSKKKFLQIVLLVAVSGHLVGQKLVKSLLTGVWYNFEALQCSQCGTTVATIATQKSPRYRDRGRTNRPRLRLWL